MPDSALSNDELAALDALISHESRREGSYLDPVWRDVLQGAWRKINVELNAHHDLPRSPIMPDLPYTITINGQAYERTGLPYAKALRVARNLIGPDANLKSVNPEYIRGQVELLCDLYGVPMDDKYVVLEEMGLPPDTASTYPPASGRYKTANVSLDEGIDLIVEAAMSLVSVDTDGCCKTLRDFYMLEGIEEALRCLLGGDEKDAHDVIVEHFAEAARSPEEEAAIKQGDLDRPTGLERTRVHSAAVRSVLINHVKNHNDLIAEILAAAETGV